MESSFQRATRAMSTADAIHLTGAYDLAALGPLPAVLADSDIGDELVARYIAPLGTGDSADAIRDTVRRYLTTDMRADLTGSLTARPSSPFHHGRFPDLSMNCPVGPSGPIVASVTMESAPSATL